MKRIRALRSTIAGWFLETFKKTGVRQWALAGLIFILLSAILLSNVLTEQVDLTVGQVAPKDIQAPQRVINRYQTELLRAAESERAVSEAAADPASYVINQTTAIKAKERVNAAFHALLNAVTPPESVFSGTDKPNEVDMEGSDDSAAESAPLEDLFVPSYSRDELADLKTVIEEQSGIDISVGLLGTAMSIPSSRLQELQALTVDFVTTLLSEERISESNAQHIAMTLSERIETSVRAGESGTELSPEELVFVTHIANQTIEPNLVLDMQRINRVKEAAAREVKPINVERGQMIVRQFDLVTEEHIQILQDLGLLKTRPNVMSALGLLLLILVMMGLFGNYLYQKNGAILANDGHLALVGLVLILVVGMAKIASVIPFEGSGYLIPVALATMLIGILIDVHVAVMAALFLSVIVGIVMGQEYKFVLVALTSGMAGAFSVSKVGERAALTRAGLWVGAVAVTTMLGLGLFRSTPFEVKYSFLGLINGVVSAVATIGLFPYLESLFGITSSIRLLELSNPNQPLLRKLLMEAPGTYHHSMIVGNLAEAAAEAIGGDSLITRVGAQYHDIGKTKRPYFFIENQYGGENPHDKIAPSLSTLIITNHVKDGVDMAKQYKLPDVVIDFIREHHGTTLVRYFYHKAVENAKGEACEEKDFRYPGPKPQTRESAVVMLADSVEAAVRTLSRPTPGRIEGLVRKILKDYLADGQLDESNLTLRDLDKIADAFVKVLTGIYHKRVDYPENVLKEIEARTAREMEAKKA